MTFIALILTIILFISLYLSSTRNSKFNSFLKYEKPILIFIIILSILNYTNFGKFHGMTAQGTPQVFHPHDAFHYVIGSKYFKQVGYERLYQSTYVALSEINPEIQNSTSYYVRQMSDYRLIKGSEILKEKEIYKRYFKDEEWNEFVSDIHVFYNYLIKLNQPDHSIFSILEDHGFNPSPLYVAVTKPILKLLPLTETTISYFAAFDFILLFIFIVLLFSFCKLRTTACVIAIFGFSVSSSYEWIGGSFCRMMFLTSLGIGFILLRKSPLFSSVFISFSVLLRIFPLFSVIGILVCSLWILLKKHPQHLNLKNTVYSFFIGLFLSTTVFVLISSWSVGSLDSFLSWQSKIKTHSSFVSANSLGLPSVIAYSPAYSMQQMINEYAKIYGRTDIGMKDGTEPSISGFIGSKRAKIVFDNSLLAIFIIAITWISFAFISQKISLTAAGIFGLSLCFLSGIQFSGYYSSFLALVPLAFWKQDASKNNYYIYIATISFLITFLMQELWASYYKNLDARSYFESLTSIVAILICLFLSKRSLVKDS